MHTHWCNVDCFGDRVSEASPLLKLTANFFRMQCIQHRQHAKALHGLQPKFDIAILAVPARAIVSKHLLLLHHGQHEQHWG